MASGKKGKSGGILEKVAAFIVDKRKAIYLVYIIMLIFCVVASNWVKVNNTLTDYLSEDTETHQGLSIMDDEFVTYATAKIMVDNVSYDRAEQLVKEIEDIDGIKEYKDSLEKIFEKLYGIQTIFMTPNMTNSRVYEFETNTEIIKLMEETAKRQNTGVMDAYMQRI